MSNGYGGFGGGYGGGYGGATRSPFEQAYGYRPQQNNLLGDAALGALPQPLPGQANGTDYGMSPPGMPTPPELPPRTEPPPELPPWTSPEAPGTSYGGKRGFMTSAPQFPGMTFGRY